MIDKIELMGFGRDVCSPDKFRTHLIPNANMIHFIEDGCGTYNGIKLKKGQGFICFKDALCDYFPDKKEPWTYSWINVTGPGAEALLKSVPHKDGVFSFDIARNITLLKDIPAKNSPTDELRCLGILFKLFADISFENKLTDYIPEAIRLMNNGISQGITVDEIAHKLNISRAYLRNIFYKRTGVSPQQYLMQLKMQRAEFLLKKPYSITEVAMASGYNDVLQFSRMFSKYHGISPTGYRKEFLND